MISAISILHVILHDTLTHRDTEESSDMRATALPAFRFTPCLCLSNSYLFPIILSSCRSVRIFAPTTDVRSPASYRRLETRLETPASLSVSISTTYFDHRQLSQLCVTPSRASPWVRCGVRPTISWGACVCPTAHWVTCGETAAPRLRAAEPVARVSNEERAAERRASAASRMRWHRLPGARV